MYLAFFFQFLTEEKNLTYLNTLEDLGLVF